MSDERSTSWVPLGLIVSLVIAIGVWSLFDMGGKLVGQQEVIESAIVHYNTANEEAILLASGRGWAFDRLSLAAKRLRESTARIEAELPTTPVGQQDGSASLTALVTDQVDRIEQLKTDLSVYRKSCNAARRLATVLHDEHPAVSSWISAAALSGARFNDKNPSAPRRDAPLQTSLGNSPQFELLDRHLTVIVERGARIEETLDAMLASPLSDYLRSVSRDGRRRREAHNLAMAIRERLQFLLLAVAATYGGMLIAQQRRAAGRLRDLNSRLEITVDERTSELTAEHNLLESLIDSLPNAVYWKGLDGVYRGCNKSYSQLLGLASVSSIVDHTDDDLPWGEETRRDKLRGESRVLESHAPIVDLPVKKSLANGVRYELISSKTVLHDATREPCGVVGIYTEVTELNNLRDRVQQEEKLQAIGQLASGIAHEINTPIQAAAANLDYLKECIQVLLDLSNARLGGASEPVEPNEEVAPTIDPRVLDRLRTHAPGAVEDTAVAINRVSEIVRAMRTMSHPGSDEKGPVDLNVLVESAATISRNRWKFLAALELDLDPGLRSVHGLSNSLSQVALNLIVNAADAIFERYEGTDKLGSICLRTRDEADWVVLEIEDNGAGMAPEVQNRIFEPFYTTKQVGKGTGQGLSITYDSVVNQHGGEIECESTVGQGTTFRIKLPALVPAPNALPEAVC